MSERCLDIRGGSGGRCCTYSEKKNEQLLFKGGEGGSDTWYKGICPNQDIEEQAHCHAMLEIFQH